MSKKNESDNNSFFIKDIDVFRFVLQTIFVYGCYNQGILGQKCNYKEDKNKNAKKFYDACLADHIGANYMINPVVRRGRPSYATYMNYKRFTNNKNFLFSVYQWSSIAKNIMFKYFVARQYIECYKGDNVCKKIKELLGEHNTFNDYFSICKLREYEHVYEFLKSVCEEDDTVNTVNRLCDALSLYGRKSLYSVPAYSIMLKLRRSYILEGNDDDTFSNSEIWDFTYDNYDKILYDNAVYTVCQAIRKKQIIGYTRSYDSDNYQLIIPLKIMNEYNLGRCYLIYGRTDSEKIHVIRFDDMFKITAYNVSEEYVNDHNLKIKRLNECFEAEKNIWISGNYTRKNEELRVTVNTDDKEALLFIEKYAPYYEINHENKAVVFTLRKADDIKPFLRSLGSKVKISRSKNPGLYNEFSKDFAEINRQYTDGQDFSVLKKR